jgi:hypothetical protein
MLVASGNMVTGSGATRWWATREAPVLCTRRKATPTGFDSPRCRGPAAVVERWPGRLRSRCDVLAARAGLVVLPSTAGGGTVSRIRATLTPGSVVTTLENTVDHVVTEHGVADMRGRSIAQRARSLIAIADPRFRDDLGREASELGYI